MLFITLGKFRKKPTKEMLAEIQRLMEERAKAGVKFLGFYWTLGRYDVMIMAEAPDEKAAMKDLLRAAEFISTETLVAVPGEEAGKLVE